MNIPGSKKCACGGFIQHKIYCPYAVKPEEWKNAANSNKTPRIDWARILGESLPSFAFKRFEKGDLPGDVAQKIFVRAFIHTGIETEELARVIKINVGARYAEYRRFHG